MKAICLSILLLIGGIAYPQSEKLARAKEQLILLKENMLLVRLYTDDNKIQALESKGYKEAAEQARQEQYNENRETLLAFKQTFDFCPVYFFYASKSEAITEGKLPGNVFDSELKPVAAEKLKADFFIGDFTTTGPTKLSGFIIKDRFFVELDDPFPFYQRKYVFFSLVELSRANMMEEYNKKLWSYYNRWVVKSQQ